MQLHTKRKQNPDFINSIVLFYFLLTRFRLLNLVMGNSGQRAKMSIRSILDVDAGMGRELERQHFAHQEALREVCLGLGWDNTRCEGQESEGHCVWSSTQHLSDSNKRSPLITVMRSLRCKDKLDLNTEAFRLQVISSKSASGQHMPGIIVAAHCTMGLYEMSGWSPSHSQRTHVTSTIVLTPPTPPPVNLAPV